MPGEVGHALLAAEEERGVGHGEQTGPRSPAERGGQAEQLVLTAHLAGQRGPARPRVADHLVRREPQRAELGALAQEPGPWRLSRPCWRAGCAPRAPRARRRAGGTWPIKKA